MANIRWKTQDMEKQSCEEINDFFDINSYI